MEILGLCSWLTVCAELCFFIEMTEKLHREVRRGRGVIMEAKLQRTKMRDDWRVQERGRQKNRLLQTNRTLEHASQNPTYLNQVHVPLISHFPCCHAFCRICRAKQQKKKKKWQKASPQQDVHYCLTWVLSWFIYTCGKWQDVSIWSLPRILSQGTKTEPCWLMQPKIATENQ